ncbi:MAG TPA: DUF892 family protein [Terriglobales bacterium]|nr:DUF892 family protein [Terriglobales bacterium]
MQSARELFVHELTDMLDAEQKLVKALGELAEDHAKEPQLQKGFHSHRVQTEKQVERIQQVLQQLGEEPEQSECKGIKGLIDERKSFKEDENPADDILSIFDVGAAIKVENYEISAYSSLIELAKQLDISKAVKLLSQSLKEEEQTRTKLQAISRKLKPDNLGRKEEGEGMKEQARSARRGAASARRQGRTRRAA